MEYEFLFDGKEATEIYNDSSKTTKPSAAHKRALEYINIQIKIK